MVRRLSFRNRLDLKLKRKVNPYLKSLGLMPLAPRVPLYFIELTNRCNLRCPMCPRSDAAESRGLGFMEFDLYKHVIQAIKRQGVRFVNLNRFGESLLYPRFVDAVRHAKEQGIPNVGIVSNATLLNQERTRGIIEAGLDRIRFSIDSLDPEEYAAGRVGATLEDTLAKIDFFIAELRRSGRKRPKVGINSVILHDNMEQLKKIYARFSPECDILFKPVAHYGISQNWDKIKEYEKYRRRPCIQPWERINFFYNGDMNVCCGDVEGELIVGNIKDHSINELWYGARAREIRRKHMALDFDDLRVCQVCSGINANWYEDALKQQREVYEKVDPSRKVRDISNTRPIVD